MIDLVKLNVKVDSFAMNAQLIDWVQNNLDEFESDQDAIDQIHYWVEMNVGRYVEVVV